MHKIYFNIILIFCILFANNLKSQESNYIPPKSRILFVLDGSQSMLSQWESGRKIDIARDLLINMVDFSSGIYSLRIVQGEAVYVKQIVKE